jgi:phage shock protein A
MKFLTALWNKVRFWDKKSAEAISNPVENADLAIDDSKAQLARFKESVRQAMASNKMLERRKKDAEADRDKYARIAKLAVDAGNDVDARQALEEKQRFERQAISFGNDIDRNNKIITQNQEMLDKVENKIVNAETNKEILSSRLESAKAREGLAKAGSELGGDGALAALDNLENAVNKAEAMAEATEVIEGVGNTSLEDKYNGVEASVEEELQRMKAGKLVSA